jgi:hypothetical protein
MLGRLLCWFSWHEVTSNRHGDRWCLRCGERLLLNEKGRWV